MPRTRPLPVGEVEICRRLKLAREQRGLSRAEIAREGGGDSSALVRIESGRVPLHYAVARWIWRGGMHLLNPVYLTTEEGKPTTKYGLWLPSAEDIRVSPAALFSEVINRYADDLRTLSGPEPSQRLPLSWIREQQHFLERQKEGIAAGQRLLESHSQWLLTLKEAARRAHQRRLLAVQAAVVRVREKNILTDTSNDVFNQPVRTWATLRDELRRLTAEPGAKTQLAKELTIQLRRQEKPIPLATLSRYLSGDMEPGGEITLALLNWVEKRKSPK